MFNVDDPYDFPRDVTKQECLCQLTGRNEAVFENYKCVKTITDTEIELICKKYKIHIIGQNLIIKYYNNESMVIGGNINGITFC